MTVRTVRTNGIELWCEDFGRAGDPALLLIMGSEGQAIMWPEDFCQALADAGFYVIRYDSRDTGQSSCFDFAKAHYTLSDMASDAVGLLDALGVERAHVVGLSGGGMVAQTLAIEHPARLRTLTSISSSPGAEGLQWSQPGTTARLPKPAPKVMEILRARYVDNPPHSVEERIEAAVAAWRAYAGSGEPFDEAAVRAREARVLARARNIDAAPNHHLAVRRSPDRDELLHAVRIPTLVIHGSDDPLMQLPHGRATADAIPGAKLVVIEGMGHYDWPAPRAQKRLLDAILKHVTER